VAAFGRPSQVLYFFYYQRKYWQLLGQTLALSLVYIHLIWTFWGRQRVPNGLIAGLISKRLSCLLGIGPAFTREVIVLMEEFASAPMIWLVFFCGSTEDKKVDTWLLKSSSFDSLYPEWGTYMEVRHKLWYLGLF
jgi:hypothetical protein